MVMPGGWAGQNDTGQLAKSILTVDPAIGLFAKSRTTTLKQQALSRETVTNSGQVELAALGTAARAWLAHTRINPIVSSFPAITFRVGLRCGLMASPFVCATTHRRTLARFWSNTRRA